MNSVNTRKKRLLLNTITPLLYQVLTIICGFILPRLILKQYGSQVNGLLHSITQFLGVICFLELGIGAVVQSALYKPLAVNDENEISAIVTAAKKFFRRLAIIFLGYVVILINFFPLLTEKRFGWLYTALLIMAMSISSFAQYYFGIVDNLVLNADQRGYVQYASQIVTLVLNTIICVILIYNNVSIQAVKLTTSLLFLLRPLIVRTYINKNYAINRKYKYKVEPLKQKWNGVAQHIAFFILDGTDTMILTVFSTLESVSIYSVYHLVVYGVKQLFMSVFNGFQSLMGELWAKKEEKTLKNLFADVEWLVHNSATFLFTCVALLVVQFVQVYTLGINDANYLQPIFGFLLTAANMVHCVRLPYDLMILAAGHYKQTQTSYMIAALLNISVSVITVSFWGIIGVAIGTLVSMAYHTVWMAWYNSKNILEWPFVHFIKHIFLDILIMILSFFSTRFLTFDNVSYLDWIILAIETVLIVGLITLLINFLFNRSYIKDLIRGNIKR